MFIAYVVVTVITIVANAGVAFADLARAEFVLANSAEVGISQSWIPLLAALKAAGAAGLLLGLLGVRFIGIAAAVGLVLFFIGAIAAHVRARVFHNIAFPGGLFVLAAVSLVLTGAVQRTAPL
ncbi:DoxX family protein [Streptosporangium sp. NPDC005286]|uniref:DoxX family protein n=1 Tax=Streptosporangium sp. NPDC005286 TaxID=3154463 RepID=UPI0033BA99B8